MKREIRPIAPILSLVLALSVSACGYHVAGKNTVIPKDTHTIAFAPWGNATIHYTLSNYLAAATAREFIAHTRYRIVSDISKADVVFYGSIANITSGATVYDNTTGKTTGGQITVLIQYRLVNRAGKILVSKPNLEFHQPYEIGVVPSQYFDESEAAMQRLSTEVAQDVVSSILSEF